MGWFHGPASKGYLWYVNIMKYFNILSVIFLLLLSSCAKKAQTGAAEGAAAGALVGQAIGHNTEATLVGAAAGTLLGSIVGKEMDKYDREQLNHNYERGISHQRSSWINPDIGNLYSVIPEPAYQDATTHRQCRRAEIEAVIKNKPEKISTTACRDAAGHWELQS